MSSRRDDRVSPVFSRPDFSRPDFSRPDFSRPDFSRPDFSRPDFSRPGFSRTAVFSTGRLLLFALLLLLVVPTTSCTSTTSPKEPEMTSDGLLMVRRTRRSQLWVKPDHHLGRYDNVMLDRVGIGYAPGQKPLDADQEAQIVKMLQTVIVSLTRDSPVGVAAEGGPCVVKINLGLNKLRLYDSEFTDSTSSYVSSFGSGTMIIEFVDSLSDTLLVRYVANRDLAGGSSTGGRSGIDLKHLGRALGGTIASMNDELARIVPTTTVRDATECNDGIYKMTGRG
jgi:hypothetical protein